MPCDTILPSPTPHVGTFMMPTPTKIPSQAVMNVVKSYDTKLANNAEVLDVHRLKAEIRYRSKRRVLEARRHNAGKRTASVTKSN
jgi:hypothetical protein